MNTETFELEQTAMQLSDQKIQGLYEITGAAGTVLQTILAMQQMTNPVLFGGIDPALNQSITLSLRWPFLWEACVAIRDMVGGYIYVESDKATPTIRRLFLKESQGLDVGQRIVFGKNIMNEDTSREFSVVTQLFAQGGEAEWGTVILSDNNITNEVATKSSDATYGYLKIGGRHSCFYGWTAVGAALPGTVHVYEGGVEKTSLWHQGTDPRYVRTAIANYNASATYTLSYRHADFLISDAYDEAGMKQDLFEDSSLVTASSLLSGARVEMDSVGVLKRMYSLQVADLARLGVEWQVDKLMIGSKVKIFEDVDDEPIDVIIVRLSKSNLAELGVDLELQNVASILADAWYRLKREIDNLKREAEVTEPSVETLTEEDVTPTSAKLNGSLKASGGLACQVRFQWGEEALDNSTPWVTEAVGDFEYNLIGLTPGTTYYFRAQATNAKGTVSGTALVFDT